MFYLKQKADGGFAIANAADNVEALAISSANVLSFDADLSAVDAITAGDTALGISGLAVTAGTGGSVVIAGGATTTSGVGGLVSVTGGAGSGTSAGGAASLVGGASGSGATGNGGAVAVTGGAAASTNGTGGAVAKTGGAGTGTGAGGAVSNVGGAGGATGAGGAVSLVGGAGGATSGTGGAVSIAGGAGTNGNANGGAVTIAGGAKHGSGANGALNIGGASTALIGFWGATAVDQPAALTAQLTSITHTAPGTPDYALQDLVQNTGFGFATADEGNTLLSVVLNLQVRLAEVEARLEEVGIVAAN